MKRFLLLSGAGLVLIIGTVGGWWYFTRFSAPSVRYQTSAEASSLYVRFDMEAYDTIQKEYWGGPSDADLGELFRLSLQKVASTTETLATSPRAATAEMLAKRFAEATSTDERRQWALGVVQVVLYNLSPAGRDQLLSTAEETALRQEVSNINPSSNLYGDLGLSKGASASEVDAAYTQKAAKLANATSSQAEAEKKQIAYAREVLTNANSKNLYDQAQIEPTLFGRTLGHTLYFNLTRISPTSLQEFALAVDQASTTPGLDSMIIDVRGNIGGSLDFLQAFLGLFIGQNQYAFDLYRKGNFEPQRTTIARFDELSRYRDIAILTDNQTQSTAELTAATFKRYRLARVVGATTRGWGTVENTYPLKTSIDPHTSYALLLVNNITLGSDNQPIEGRGVVPDVDIGNPNWKNKLSQYFLSSSLISALRQTAAQPPLK